MPPAAAAGAVAGAGAADAASDPTQRVATTAGQSATFDCDDGRSFVATYNDPAYNGATSIAMQAPASGQAATPPSGNVQVSLGENTATLKDGETTINCRARQ